MRIRHNALLGLSLAAGLTMLAADKPKMGNVQGRVQMMNKDNSTITVELKGGVRRNVIYSSDTRFLYGHSRDSKPGAWDQVKESYYISCAGTFDPVDLKAKECVYREQK